MARPADAGVAAVTQIIPLSVRVEPPTNDPDVELCFYCCQGLPPARQKAVVMKLVEHGKVDQGAATLAMTALGIGDA